MRTAGQWIGKLRRLSTELRSQSGIDEIIRQEGLEAEIRELRSLSRVNVIDTLVTTATAPTPPPPAARPRPPPPPALPRSDEPPREREYPLLGCDAYDSLPDDVEAYLREEASAGELGAQPEKPAPPPAPKDVKPVVPRPAATGAKAAKSPERGVESEPKTEGDALRPDVASRPSS